MNIALLLAGGTGTRLGGSLPKQYIEVSGRPVISYCLNILEQHHEIHAVQIVAEQVWHDFILKWTGAKLKGFSTPGRNRQLSIYHGLTDILSYAQDSDIVLIHDAARPLLSNQIITNSLEAIEGHDGVLPVLSMKDTVYRSIDGKKISTLLERDEIFAGQAPEAFRLGLYYEANKVLFPDKILKINGATEPAVMAGMDIVMIPGDEKNFKITTREDLERFCAISPLCHKKRQVAEGEAF